LISKIEQKVPNVSFARVDSDPIERLIQKDEELPSKLSEEEQDKLKPFFDSAVPSENYTVQFENLSETDAPIMVTQAEFMRRMQEQQATGGMNMMGNMPEMYSVIVNANHPLQSKILKAKSKGKKEALAKQATDLALLSQGMLKGEALTNFINRSIEEL
jgi:molecular chaperone HtpG